MIKLQCAHCGGRFVPAPQVSKQLYCSKPECQKERRRLWQANKLKTDPAYRENQARAQQAWTQKNPDYWREHRQPSDSPMKDTSKLTLSKSVSDKRITLSDGIFKLRVLTHQSAIKMDVWIVELTSIYEG